MRLLITLILLISSSVALAQQVPSPVQGFVHARSNQPPSNFNHGVLLSPSSSGISSPAVGEIDGNKENGLEVAVVSRDGKVSVLSSQGQLLWEYALPNSNCPVNRSDLAHSSPAIGELYGNGVPYVVVGYGGLRTKACGGGVVALHGASGRLTWHFNLKRYAERRKIFAVSYAVFSTPTLADTDGNGTLEVGFGGLDRHIYFLNAKGKVLWTYVAADTVFSSPVFYNVDSEPTLEMIIGTDISGNKVIQPPTKNGGLLYALKTHKRSKKKFNFRDPQAVVWMQELDQVVQSSPVVADVIPGGAPEVIVGSGCYFPENSKNKLGKWIKIFRLTDGKLLRTLNTEACLSSTVAVADIDSDGTLEIVASVNGNSAIGGTGSGKLAAWKADSSEPIWISEPRSLGQNDSYLGTIQSPVIADIDGNGSLEVLLSNASNISLFDARTGLSYGCDNRTCESNDVFLNGTSTIKNTPAVADINRDGKLDVILAGTNRSAGRQAVYAWTNFEELEFSSSGVEPAYSLPWGQFKNRASRQSVY